MDIYGYYARIADATSLDEMNDILEEAAWDDYLSNAEYTDLCDAATRTVKEWWE